MDNFVSHTVLLTYDLRTVVGRGERNKKRKKGEGSEREEKIK